MKQALIDLREKVLAAAPVAAIVARRMYPNYFPEGTDFPALTYAKSSVVRLWSLDGPTGYASARVTIGAWSDNYAAALTLAEAVRIALDKFRGTFGSTFFQSIKCETDLDTFAEATDQEASSPGIHRLLLDFTVSFNEP
jgi:hypothetical protein